MYRHLGLFLGLILLLTLSGCRKKEFSVEFNLSPDVNETITLIYYASDSRGGWLVEQVVTLNKGQGKVVTPAINPALVYINKVGASTPNAIFYAERGNNFKVTGKGDDPLNWDITGNKITEQLSQWRLSSTKAIEDWRKNPEKGSEAVNKRVSEYVTKNPADPTSAILMLTYFDRRNDERGFETLWGKLKDEAKEGKWAELAARTDMFEYEPVTKLPERILLKTGPNGCDTIVPGRVPTLLYFSPKNNEEARPGKDSIRNLSRHYKDSTKRVIAEISFDKDSMTRVYNSRRDSFVNVVQAWMPLGISDSTATALGVYRAPWLIVIDKKKKIIYSGSDMKEAIKIFRKEL